MELCKTSQHVTCSAVYAANEVQERSEVPRRRTPQCRTNLMPEHLKVNQTHPIEPKDSSVLITRNTVFLQYALFYILSLYYNKNHNL